MNQTTKHQKPGVDARNLVSNPEAEDADHEPGIWDQMEGESLKHYGWFLIYRDLGVAKRNLAEVCRRTGSQDRQFLEGISISRHIAELSSRWAWRKRAEAWDEHKIKQARDLEMKLRKDDVVRKWEFMRRTNAKLGGIAEASLEKMETMNRTLAEARDAKDLMIAFDKWKSLRDMAHEGVAADTESGDDQMPGEVAAMWEEFQVWKAERLRASQAAVPKNPADPEPTVGEAEVVD